MSSGGLARALRGVARVLPVLFPLAAAAQVPAPVAPPSPVRHELLLFESVPEAIPPRDAAAFSDWFSATYPATLAIPAGPPLREGWQWRRSHVRVFADRIVVDAPMAPGIGDGMVRVCRITVPLGEGRPGWWINASAIGFAVSSQVQPCADTRALLARIDRLPPPDRNRFGRPPVALERAAPLGRTGWRAVFVTSWDAAVEARLIPTLRAAGLSGQDPVVSLQRPVAPAALEQLDPLEYSHFHADGLVVTSLTFGFSVTGGDGNLPAGACVLVASDRSRLFDDDPAVLAWCRAQAERSRRLVDATPRNGAIPVAPPAPPRS